MNPAETGQDKQEHRDVLPSRSEWVGLASLIGLVIVGALLVAVKVRRDNAEWVKDSIAVATVDAGKGRTIVLTSPNGTEPLAQLRGQVFENGKSLSVNTIVWGSTAGSDAFKKTGYRIVHASDGNVVGLVADIKPETILMMVDFKNRQTWPGNLDIVKDSARIHEIIENIQRSDGEKEKAFKLDGLWVLSEKDLIVHK